MTEVPAELAESVDCSNIQLPNFITANLKVILKNINDKKKDLYRMRIINQREKIISEIPSQYSFIHLNSVDIIILTL